ncbi:glycosyl hydrolase family 18 [Alistipes sp.]|uniref:EndoS/ChiA family endoglycosidase n=1 Tax=Alistipes sp. TaxID=1872444 RepID=UPI003AF185A6
MKRYLISIVTMLATASAMLFASCANDMEEPQMDGTQPQETRTYGDKTPKVQVYIEINDNDPRIATSYHLGTAVDGPVFIDILQLFASNIHKDGTGYPTLYFNDKMAPMFEAVNTYVKPLQDAGMKVCLTVLGDWQKIGVANLNVDQADRFADILTYVVDHYNLDGIGFDDEYANYDSTVSGSYSRVIKALRAKLDQKFGTGADRKLITVFDWGYTNQIDATAGAMIDFVDQGIFGANSWYPTDIPGVPTSAKMPQAIQLGNSYNAIALNQIKNRSAQAASGGYGGIMCFNMRRASDVNPLPVFKKIAEGAFNSTVTYDGTDYTRNWTTDPDGYTITKEMAGAYLPKYTE